MEVNWKGWWQDAKSGRKYSKSFWNEIWGRSVSHNENAQWLKELEEDLSDIEKQGNLNINYKEDNMLEGTRPRWPTGLLAEKFHIPDCTFWTPTGWVFVATTCTRMNGGEASLSWKIKRLGQLLQTSNQKPAFSWCGISSYQYWVRNSINI